MKRFFFLSVAFFAINMSAYAQTERFEKPNTQKVKVFPNPATHIVNILGLQNSVRAEITITDTSGNKILQHRWAINNNALNIPISSLEPGIYIITIRSEEQQVQTKFYKQ